MDAEDPIAMNGMHPKDDEMKWNHKKRTKDRFLLFCETVLNHERELLSETLNSSQESISENLAPEGRQNNSEQNSTFNSDSDGGANYTNEPVGDDGGDSFNSVTCFCGKPFAGRPMIECSACLTWYHMSCVKVKRKNIPEFYYCDSCKNNGMLSPSNALGTSTASSGEESGTPVRPNGITLSSNSIISPEGILYSTHQNQSSSSSMTMMTKQRKPKTMKKSSASSLLMNSSDNIKNNNSNSDSKYLTKKSSTVNGKLKKIRQTTTKKMRPTTASPPTTKGPFSGGYAEVSAANSLTALSLNHHVSSTLSSALQQPMISSSNGTNGVENSSSNVLKSPQIAANNNNIYNGSSEVMETKAASENGDSDKFNNKRLKLL